MAGRKKAVRTDATGAILESISDGVFTVDERWKITSFNRAAEEITGIARREALGKQCSDVFRASMCETDCALRRTMESGKPIINKPAFIIDSEGRRIPISVSTAILRDASGRIAGGAETFRDLSVVEELRKELEGRFQMGDLVSRSPVMRRIFDILPQAAASESAVLVQGETGTGKELVARAIHGLSPRRNGPFVAINCGALPEALLESELFGYETGAFTGADRRKPGRFAAASGGTILLDEIGETTPSMQVKLLRALQEKAYEPLGSNETKKADTRIIAATNRDLADLMRRGTFRRDLFYRINVLRIELPPLRKRREDVPLLVEHFIAKFNLTQGKSINGVSPDVTALLMAHDYPGNVRELENIIEHAFVLCAQGTIEPRHLPESFVARMPVERGCGNVRTSLRAAEAQAIAAALERNSYNRARTAAELGVHKSTLFRKVKSLGIVLPPEDGRYKRNKDSA